MQKPCGAHQALRSSLAMLSRQASALVHRSCHLSVPMCGPRLASRQAGGATCALEGWDMQLMLLLESRMGLVISLPSQAL